MKNQSAHGLVDLPNKLIKSREYTIKLVRRDDGKLLFRIITGYDFHFHFVLYAAEAKYRSSFS